MFAQHPPRSLFLVKGPLFLCRPRESKSTGGGDPAPLVWRTFERHEHAFRRVASDDGRRDFEATPATLSRGDGVEVDALLCVEIPEALNIPGQPQLFNPSRTSAKIISRPSANTAATCSKAPSAAVDRRRSWHARSRNLPMTMNTQAVASPLARGTVAFLLLACGAGCGGDGKAFIPTANVGGAPRVAARPVRGHQGDQHGWLLGGGRFDGWCFGRRAFGGCLQRRSRNGERRLGTGRSRRLRGPSHGRCGRQRRNAR